MKFIKQTEYVVNNSSYEPKNSREKITVPDCSLTIQDMLQKSLNGALPPIQMAHEFTGESIRPRVKDYADLHELLDAHKAKTSILRKRQLDEIKSKQEAAKEAEKAKIIEDYITSQQQQQT